MDRNELIERLEKVVEGLDQMINSVMLEAMANDVDPYAVQNNMGTPLLAPLIISQSGALITLAGLGHE